MTPQEAIMIAKYVAAACPQQRFNEHTPDVWGDILAPYSVDEARTAVTVVAARQPFISPAEIIAEVKARRGERIEQAHVLYDGNPKETGAESAASRRALIQAAADGQLPPRTASAALGTTERLALPPGETGPYTSRVAAVRAAVARAIPTAREGVVNPRAVACRICQALPGSSCTTRGRRRQDVHPSRLDDARRTAAGQPLTSHDDIQREQQRRLDASRAALDRLAALEDEDAGEP